MDDNDHYRRQMDEKLIGFLAAHEVWMSNDTAWKAKSDARLDSHAGRIKALENWRTYLLGIWAAVLGGWYLLTGGHK